jgi:hypothetical protein
MRRMTNSGCEAHTEDENSDWLFTSSVIFLSMEG